MAAAWQFQYDAVMSDIRSLATGETKSDSGYALVAALTAVLAFTLLAFEVLASNRGSVALASAEFERARLATAADAGVMMAIAGLATDDVSVRWPIDGSRRQMEFDGVTLAISVEDERGKIPINLVNEDQVRAIFEVAGISGERLETLVDSFEDWIDDDDDPRTHGAEAAWYAPRGIKPRNGAFRTLDELVLVKGMDQELYRRLKSSLTVDFGVSGGFSAVTGQPFAVAVMTGAGMGSPLVLQRERELAGQIPSSSNSVATPLAGRLLTVRVVSSDDDDAQFSRAALVEMTGNAKSPYWIRWLPN